MNQIIHNLLQAGLSIIPVAKDKRPIIASWEPYQHAQASPEVAETWFPPIAIVGGHVSGGVVCLDFDDKGSQFDEFGYLVCQEDSTLMSKLVIQKTPSGGYHCVYRTEAKIGNTKLADRLPTPEEVTAGETRKKIVLIETRGEGGYFLIDPSPGYELYQGDFLHLATISTPEHESLITCARSLNQVSTEVVQQAPAQAKQALGVSPFDDYDSRCDPIDELKIKGWTVISRRGDVTYLRRPGKKIGISASWNKIPNRLYVFSTSTDFTNNKVYKGSAVYAQIHHNGDYGAAAKDLLKKGFGTKKEIAPPDVDTAAATTCLKASDFREAIFSYYQHEEIKGKRIGLSGFGGFLRIERGHLSVITGVPTAGKSMFMDFLSVKMAMFHKWKWVVFSPENYPMEIHFNKLAITHLGRRPQGNEDVALAIDFIDKHFRFIDATEDDLNIEMIMGAVLECKNSWGCDGMVIDPWNEIESSRPPAISETDYIGTCLRRLRKFARKNKISLWIVAHPTKLQKDKTTGEYPVPTMYDISSSANWFNKVDNGIILHRGKSEIVRVLVAKVKYRDYGAQGEVQMKYDFQSGQYSEIEEIF